MVDIKVLAKNIENELKKKKDIKLFKMVKNAGLFVANSYAGVSKGEGYAPIEVPENLLVNESNLLLPFDNVLLQTVKELEYGEFLNTSSILVSKTDIPNRLKFHVFRTVPKLVSISWGEFEYELIDSRNCPFKVISPSYSIVKDHYTGKWNDDDESDDESYIDMLRRSIIYHVSYAVRYLLLINNQKRFIVETTFKSKNTNKKSKEKRIRSTFRLSSPRMIRKSMQISNTTYNKGEGTPIKVGHERRAHWRTFRSDRYVNMKGKQIKIEAYWAGPTSYTDPKDPNKVYKVRLDL
jgi:hypothetical protein